MIGVGTLNWERFIKPLLGLGAPDAARVQHGEALLTQCIDVLDADLGAREFVCGSRLSLADLALATPFMHLEHADLPLGEAAHVRRWLAPTQARESWKRTSL